MSLQSKKPLIKYSKSDIQEAVEDIAYKINTDFSVKGGEARFVFICILDGAFMFFSDLIKQINLPNVEVDFIKIKSYDGKLKGHFDILSDIKVPLKGKHVFLVDEICDSGQTFINLSPYIGTYNPRSINTVSLLRRYSTPMIYPQYYGYEIENDDWVYGYGMDLDGYQRNLEDILVI